MSGKIVLLISVLALLTPLVLLSEDDTVNVDSDTKRSIRVVIRHCAS